MLFSGKKIPALFTRISVIIRVLCFYFVPLYAKLVCTSNVHRQYIRQRQDSGVLFTEVSTP